MGESVCKTVQWFWFEPQNIKVINQIDICLIPKTSKAEFMSQFRPISLFNVSYKILTKVITNRLKPIISVLVSPYQTRFIPTSIHERIVVAQELMHTMRHKKGKMGYFVIKVDLAKAYNRMRWDFVLEILKEIHLPHNLRDVVMNCISTVPTKFLWNGRRTNFFSP